MKVFMIGSDRNLFREGAEARARIVGYGALADELHIVVFTLRNMGAQKTQIGKNVWAYPTNSFNRLLYPFDAYRAGRRIVSEGWLVSCQDPFEAGLAGWLLKLVCKVRLQLQVHTDFLSPYFACESFLNKMRVRMARFLLPKADGVRVVSERIKRSLIQVGVHAEKIAVLPIFVDIERIKNAPIKIDLRKKYSKFDFIALMASRFAKEKNIPLAIEAMADAVRAHPKAGLIIIGSGPEERNIARSVSRFKLDKHVIIEQWTDDLASYYKTADVFMLTSNYEGYGRTAVEALAAGTPVVITDVGLAGELVKDGKNGYVIPVGDVHACAAALKKVMQKALPQISIPTGTKAAYLERYKELWNRSVL